MILQMKYFLIVSVGIKRGERVGDFKPDWVTRKQFYRSAIEKEDGILEYKYISRPLTQRELLSILERGDFVNTCNTMGSITLEYGWQSAVSFSDDYGRVNAYISPIAHIPEKVQEIAEQETLLRERINAFFERHLEWLKEFFETDEKPEEEKYIDAETLPLFL